jgi:hypothetical protein
MVTDSTKITFCLTFQDIRTLDETISYVNNALKQLVHYYKQAAKRTGNDTMTEKYQNALAGAEAFKVASDKLLNAFADSTCKLGISPFDW